MEGDFAANRSARIGFEIVSLVTGIPFQPTAVFMTLYDTDRAETGTTPAIVNGRIDVNITSSVTGGVGEITLTEADMAMLDATKDSERRGLLIYWDYNGGADSGEKIIRFTVYKNKVPTS